MCCNYVFFLIVVLNILIQTILNCAVTSLWSEFVIVPAYERAFVLHVSLKGLKVI